MLEKARPSPSKLKEKLESLLLLERSELAKCWQEIYETSIPSRISQQLLLMALSYGIQQKALRGLKPATRAILSKVAKGKISIEVTPDIKPGTRLLREWHGQVYEVTVQEKGFLFEGKSYRSLTTIADLITGAHLSGPVFFGIKRRKT